jgi:hypothetical protein
MRQPFIPSTKAQSRPASIEEVKALMQSTSNPRFAMECERFIALFSLGDEVAEFCASIQDWRTGAGREGFNLLRDGSVVAELLTKMS